MSTSALQVYNNVLYTTATVLYYTALHASNIIKHATQICLIWHIRKS